MQEFGKKLRDWRAHLKKIYMRGLTIEDERVCGEHIAYLIQYWSTERARKMSLRNKASRAKRTYDHATGSKSFAKVKKELAVGDQFPTRVEMFKKCFTKKDGTQSDPVKNAIDKSKENPNRSSEGVSRNDTFAQAMGKDKNGRVLMYGGGVCPSLVYNDVSGHQNQIINALQEQLKELKTELNATKAKGVQGIVGYNVAWPKAFVVSKNLDHFPSELHSMNLGV